MEDKNELVQTFINRNKDFLDNIRTDFEEWIKQYMGEEVPEEERILSYTVGGVGSSGTTDNSGIINATVTFSTENASKDSIWNEVTSNQDPYLSYLELNTCYIEVQILDEENYEIAYIGREPRNLEEFKKQFEEYKREHQETVVVPADETNNLNSSNVVKISNGINIVAGILIVLSVGFVIFKMIKLKK